MFEDKKYERKLSPYERYGLHPHYDLTLFFRANGELYKNKMLKFGGEKDPKLLVKGLLLSV